MSDNKYIGVTIIAYFISFFISGVYYLVVANNWDFRWDNAILDSVEVYTKTSCSTSDGHTSCSNTYYVEEIFKKFANTTSTCTVRRLTPYYMKGDANSFAERTILGTYRTIYQTTYSAGTCFDNKIRYQWNVYGGVFLALSMLPIMVILYFLVCHLIGKFKEWINQQSYSVSRTSGGNEMKSYSGGAITIASENNI